MIFDSLASFRTAPASSLGNGPFAVLIVEDRTELASTIDHLHALAFRTIFVLAPDGVHVPDPPEGASGLHHTIRHPSRQSGTTEAVVNILIDKVPGQWIHYCYNGEYLFFPFCEDRAVGELVTWVMEERRAAVLTYVIDLYAGDLGAHPDAVDLDGALLDSAGYFAEPRRTAPHADTVLERQMDFYGGLRWRFEEHVAGPRRRIDRVGLFQAQPGLRLRADHTLSNAEMNTYACPWHNSLSAAICSFRAAKALRSNPASRHDISDFRWHGSKPFQWSSIQLMELGLMEPGQWS